MQVNLFSGRKNPTFFIFFFQISQMQLQHVWKLMNTLNWSFLKLMGMKSLIINPQLPGSLEYTRLIWQSPILLNSSSKWKKNKKTQDSTKADVYCIIIIIIKSWNGYKDMASQQNLHIFNIREMIIKPTETLKNNAGQRVHPAIAHRE